MKILSDRAATLLRLERWEAALLDAEAALRIEPANAKCKLRLATALLCLQRPDASQTVLDELLSELPSAAQATPGALKTAAEALRKDVGRALAERRGEYDLRALTAEANMGRASGDGGRLSRRHQDFESPLIEVCLARSPRSPRSFARVRAVR